MSNNLKIGIIGSGKMGTDIFYCLREYPFEMVLLCLNENEKQKAETAFGKKLNRQLKAGANSEKENTEIIQKTLITNNPGNLSGCNFIIEAIWEQTEAKQELFRTLDEILSENAVITTNTSSIPIMKLIPSLRRRSFFSGLHFFYPVKIRNIVELNTSEFLSDGVLKTITEFCDTIGKKYLILQPEEHFLLNRMLLPLQIEAFRIFSEGGASKEHIDAYVKSKLNLPAGVFDFFDSVGLDIMAESVKNYRDNFPVPEGCAELISFFRQQAEAGKLGIKSGEGFYRYPREVRNVTYANEDKSGILKRLDVALFGSVKEILEKKICDRELMIFAINEYLGTDIIRAAQSTGFVF